MTNRIYHISTDHAITTDPDHILLRVYGSGIDWMFSRAKEYQWAKQLAEAGITPRWLGTFSNGRMEEYVHSETFTARMLREPLWYHRVARNLARIHQFRKSIPDEPETLWRRIDKWRLKAVAALDKIKTSSLAQDRSELQYLYSNSWIFTPNAIASVKNRTKESSLVFAHSDVTIYFVY